MNRTAEQAQVQTIALDPAWRLRVGGARSYELSLSEVEARVEHEAWLPIACVEGWSALAHWRGLRLIDLVERAGGHADSVVRVHSLEPAGARLSRRRLLTATGAAAGIVTLATVGQTLRPLRAVSLLAPRNPTDGPQGLAVNRTAAAAGIGDLAGYRLTVAGPGSSRVLDLAQLTALPQHTVDLPIACVEGWSAGATWTGVRLRDLVALVGADPDRAEVDVESLQPTGRYRRSTVEPPLTADPLTLIALRLNGDVLHPDHGYPARLIAPNRPGVLQTKWVGRLTVRSPR